MLQGRNVARESSLRTAVCAAMWGTCCRTTVVLGRSTKLQQQLVPARLGLNSAGLQPAKDICCVPGTLRTCKNRYFEIARLQLQVLLPNKSVVRGDGECVGELLLATCHSRSIVCLQHFACVWLHNSSNMKMFFLYETIRAYNNNNNNICYFRHSPRRFRCDSDAIPIRFD